MTLLGHNYTALPIPRRFLFYTGLDSLSVSRGVSETGDQVGSSRNRR